MAKLIKKSKCKFEAGHIVKKNKLVGLPYSVWYQLNKLELMAQQYAHLVKQDKYCPGPTLEGFKRKSVLDSTRPYVEVPDTPIMDKQVAEAMAFMAEADSIHDAEQVNEAIDEFGDLIDWCAGEKFIAGDCFKPIDTPECGNPLELEVNDIVHFLKLIINNPIIMRD